MTHRFLPQSHPPTFIFVVLICMMSLMVAALRTPTPAAADTDQPVNIADSPATIGSIPLIDENDPAFSKTYAYVLQPPASPEGSAAGVPVFASPEDALNNAAPVKFLTPGYDWVTVHASAELSATQFAQINDGQWVNASMLATGRASTFQGRVFDKNPDKPFAWVIKAVQPSSAPGGEANADAPVYQRYDLVYIYGKALAGKVMWYRVGENAWVPQARVSVVSPRRAPRNMTPRQRLHSKWISVNLFEQNVAAYEGERLVFVSLVSSGLPKWETVRGTFQIWSKNTNQAMFNEESGDGRGHYYLEDVPYTMYFHEDYALHGAYWHDGFGYKHSHGCVNLSPRDAKWLFNWSTPTASQWGYGQASAEDPGTWVTVY